MSNLDYFFRALRWRRLYYQRLERKSLLMYKALNGMTPNYLATSFPGSSPSRPQERRGGGEGEGEDPGNEVDYLGSRFVYRDNVTAYRLRNTEEKLVLPQPRTYYLKVARASSQVYDGS